VQNGRTGERENGQIVELTGLLDLSAWPTGSRVTCRRERPHPGAQYRFTDIDGHRFQVLLTDTPSRGNGIAALELRHRQHARVEDRIRNGKDRGLRNLPCQDLHANAAWVELALPQPTSRPGPKRSASPASSARPNPSASATAPCTSLAGSSTLDAA